MGRWSNTGIIKRISWSIYLGLIFGLLIIFGQIYTFHISSEGINDYQFGPVHNKYVYLTINDIDPFSHTMDCEIEIESWESLSVRMLHVTSWYEDAILKSFGIGPTFDAYFIYPSDEEIMSGACFDQKNGTLIDLDRIKRDFKFKIFSGNPSFWYPFDTYDVNCGISLLNASGSRQFAYPVNVTTVVKVNDPEFYMTNKLNMLTFQKEAENENAKIVPENTFSFTLERGLFLRYLTIYIYIIACIFLIYIGFSKAINDLLAGSIGYFAALWGIRNIISGKIEIFPTIIDYITLILFTTLLLIIIGRLLHNHFIIRD